MEKDFKPCELCWRDTEDWQEFALRRPPAEPVYICGECRRQIKAAAEKERQAFWEKYCLEPSRPYGTPPPTPGTRGGTAAAAKPTAPEP